MTKMKQPADLPEYLLLIWAELEGQVRPAIGAAGLEALCVQVYRMRDAERRIAEDGLIVRDVKGNPVAHPALDIEKRAQVEVRTWLAEYGAIL